MPITEADTCRKYVLPKLYEATWTDDQISEQKTFTDGRIIVLENKCKRREQKRADYILRYRRDYMIAVIEAKSAYRQAADGLQQAKEYAQTLGLGFAYATNGKSIIEYNFLTGKEREIETFPSPDQLWMQIREAEGIRDEIIAQRILAPGYRVPGKSPRYYQEIAINRIVKVFFLARNEFWSQWLQARGKPSWRFRSYGSCGMQGGTESESIGVRRYSILPTVTSW